MAYEFLAELEEIYSGAQAGPADRWSATNFFDKVVLAQPSVPVLYWPGGGKARPVPGLDPNETWDGVVALAGHLLLWRGTRIKYCDLNDFTNWIPVGETAASVRATLGTSFVHPSKGNTSAWIYLTESNKTFVVDQFVRVDINPDDPQSSVTNFYTVDAVANTVGLSASGIAVNQIFSRAGAGFIFTTAQVEFPSGSKLLIDGKAKKVVVTGVSNSKAPTMTTSAASEPLPLPGSSFSVNLSTNPTGLKVGDFVSIGDLGEDIYQVKHVGFTLQLTRMNKGTQKHAAGFVFPSGTTIVPQPYIAVDYSGTTVLTFKHDCTITAQGALKVKGLGLTGETLPGSTVSAGNVIASLDANEAGEFVNAGANINGEIYAVVELKEYGLILKHKSIQTLQYVGQGSGVFFTRTEIADDGPIAKNAWARLDASKIVFCGESEIFEYGGGQDLVPVGQQWTKEMFAELDRGRKDEIVFYHNKQDDQVWMVFPSLKTTKIRVAIYNYREKSVVIDDYDEAIRNISAIGAVEWEVAPTWNSLSDTQLWNGETKRWWEYVDEGLKRYTIIAVGGDTPSIGEFGEFGDNGVPRLLLHGRQFSRASGDNCDPQPYLALAETIDYDFKDETRIKYVDTVIMEVEIRKLLQAPMNLYVQIGCRDNLDSTIRWSNPAVVEVAGNGMRQTKVNIRGHGRFVRVRFYSDQIGIQWRVAGFVLVARPGGTY